MHANIRGIKRKMTSRWYIIIFLENSGTRLYIERDLKERLKNLAVKRFVKRLKRFKRFVSLSVVRITKGRRRGREWTMEGSGHYRVILE